MSLYETIMQLCNLHGITKTKLERDCGFSQNSINKWTTQSPSMDKILKVANYFNVSVDYLVGKTDTPTPLTSDGSSVAVPDKYGDVLVALNEGDKDLTQDDIDQIVRFIKFTREQKKN